MVIEYLNQNARNAQLVIRESVKQLRGKGPNQYAGMLKSAIFTAPDLWPAATFKKLEAIIGKYRT